MTTPEELAKSLDALKERIFHHALEVADELEISHIYMPQAIVMAAAMVLLDMDDKMRKDVAQTQALNSFGGAIKTMIMNGMDIPPYDLTRSGTVDIYLGPAKLDS